MDRPAPDTPASSPAMFSGLRPVRTLCMLTIVAYHVRWTEGQAPEPLMGVSFGLNTLQIILCALVARGVREPAAGPFFARRTRRLLRPWIIWSGVYIAVKVAQSVRYGRPWSDQLEPSMWLYGGSYHLWFLLYGLAASAFALVYTRACRGERALAGALVAATLGAVALLFGQVSQQLLQPIAPLDLWLDGLPAVLFGVAIGRALSIQDPGRRRLLFLLFSALAVLPLLLGSHLAPESQLWARYAVAVPLACAGFALRAPELPLLTWLAERNMGVYVVHVLAIQVVDRTGGLGSAGDLMRILSVYALSIGIVSGLDRVGRLLAGRRPEGSTRSPATAS